MPIRDMILPEFDHEMTNTRKLLECVPDDKLDYKPHEKSMSMRHLAGHVTDMAKWSVTTMQTEALELELDKYQPFLPKSRKELLEAFDNNVKEGRAALAAATDEQFGVAWSLKAGGKTFFTMPRSAVVRSMVINHIIHHRAQLGVYLRLNNVEFPGMYGPSADEMKAFGMQKA